MPHLALSLLGPFHLSRDGQPVTALATDKARALLAFLAVEADRPHRRESLAGRLWPDQPEAAALHSLRQTLHQLRRSLDDDNPDPPILVITPKTVQFNPASQVVIDVVMFTGLLTACAHHPHVRLERCSACVARLEQAVGLYRGDLLEGFFVRDNLLFEDWLFAQRERLQRQALDALSHLAVAYERRGRYDLAQQAAQRQLALDPTREIAHRQLIRALALGGERTAALAQYETYRRLLAEELDVEPTDETTALYERIRRGQPLIGLYHFPARLTSFVGREAELAQIGKMLVTPACRLLTLVGPGGSGKTRLAVEAALVEAAAFQDGACFVALAPLVSGELIAPALLSALGIPPSASQDAKMQALAVLRPKELLLVLDNFEHLLTAATLVSEILQTCPKISVLVTSREPLDLYGEYLITIAPLPTPHLTAGHQAVSALAQIPSVQLFVDRARMVLSHFELNEVVAPAVAEMCDRLDGLPLAIELAAARVSILNPHDLLARLKQSFTLLPPGARDLPERQRTLWQTIEWSYALLTLREQRLFRCVSVFSGGFTPETVAAVCSLNDLPRSEVASALVALAHKSLIYRVQPQDETAEPVRYAVLATISEYMRVKLEEAGEAEELRRSHLHYFIQLAEESEVKLPTAERPRWLARLDAEQDNLQTALEQAFTAEPASALQLATALGTAWEVRVRLFTGRQVIERALAGAPEASAVLRAKALYWLGRIGLRQGVLRQARLELSASQALYRDLGDEHGLAFALNDLGSVAHWQGDYETAQAVLEESLAIRRGRGVAWWTAQALNNLGMTAFRRGDYPAAQLYFDECLSHFQQTGAEMPLAWPFGGLGQVALARHDFITARRLIDQSVAIWRKHRFNWALAYRLNDLGLLMHVLGDQASAQRIHRESLTIAQEIGDLRGLTFALEGLARVALAQGEALRSAQLFSAAEAHRQVVGTALGALEREWHGYTVAQARARLGELAFELAWRQGRMLTLDQTIAYALEEDHAATASHT